LLTASAACRITARYEEGLAFVAQAFEHATSHKRGARLSHVLVAELRLHVAGGAYDRAESALRRMIECSISPDDTFAQAELQFYKTRIALERGDLQEASAAFSTVKEIPQTYSARRRAHSLALGLRIRLRENPRDDELWSLVSGLEVEHLKLRSLGDQDFEAYALYLGLCALGDRTRALDLLTDYVTVHRRSEWPLPEEIAQTVRPYPEMSTAVKRVNNRGDQLGIRFQAKVGEAVS
jgi:tetratricopeptide (TPR) repeat protein